MGQQPLQFLEVVVQQNQPLEHQQPLVHQLLLVHLRHSEVHLLQVQPEVLPPEVVFLAANKLNKQMHSEVLQQQRPLAAERVFLGPLLNQPLPRVYSEVPHLTLHLLVLLHLMLHLLVHLHPMLHLLVLLHNNKVQAYLEHLHLHLPINNLLEVEVPYLEV